jgi:hypothetical protein
MSKKVTAALYLTLCALEGFWPLLFLYNPDHTGSAFLGLSPLRLALVTSITLTIAFLTILATSEWLAKANQGIRIDRLLARRFMILLTFSLFAASLVGIYLLVFSPLRVEPLTAITNAGDLYSDGGC